MGDGRPEGSSAIGDRGQAAVLLMPDVDGTHVLIFENSQLKVVRTYCRLRGLTVE